MAADGGAGTDHRHERHDTRAARDQQHRANLGRLPDEVAADGASQLELVPGAKLVGEVGRHLAVVETFDRQLEVRSTGSGSDRVAPLDLVAVLRRQAHVDVLARTVPGPPGNIEDDRLRACRLALELDDVGQLPGQSPW